MGKYLHNTYVVASVDDDTSRNKYKECVAKAESYKKPLLCQSVVFVVMMVVRQNGKRRGKVKFIQRSHKNEYCVCMVCI